jgi:hypothetical protein
LNYFNYFTEIEDAFIRRRAKHLLLSPMDWALIESWKEMEVPLHVALRGIEKAFDSWEAKPRKRSIKSLLYCQEEVEAQFAEWREARVGSDSGTASENGSSQTADSLPFSRAAIMEHMRRGRESLEKISAERTQAGNDDLSDVLTRAAALLLDLENDFTASASPEAQKLEQSLSGLERMISDGLRVAVSSEQMAMVEREVKDQLKPYRKHMEPAAYEQTFQNLLLKRLRELFGIPRLSLFYL